MRIAVALAVAALAALPVVLAAQEAAQKPDPSKLEMKLTGCVRGTTLTETNLRIAGATDEGPTRRWRLRAPKSLIKLIKQHEGRELEIAGTTKNRDSMTAAGTRIGKTNIYIGGDTNRTAMRDPLPELPTIDVESFEPTGEQCR